MPKKTKTKGKSRQDKFYHLAKETGYRSRAAFKLIQLNRKFDFLPRCRVCIDLCAAPGGWMQVAKQHMPVSSLIVGVDLFPIRPIAGTVALLEDITTDKCRASLKAELKTWKADLILHDGAPNVGQNWIHDAFIQNQLVLSALKLSTEFLQKGGWFITKIFRSKDYQSLIWALSQLFKKVQSTKPQASRLETAEIFVICQGFKAPDKLDPRFLDPKFVFKEVEPTTQLTKAQPQLGAPLPRKPKAEGYEEGKLNLHRAVPVMEFINSETYLDILANATEITLDDKYIASHPSTTPELIECFRDIKVLGKKDIRDIINWRKALKKELEKAQAEREKLEPKEEVVEEKVDELDEEEKELNELDTEIESLKTEKEQEIKRKKKKVMKERKKLVEKMNLDMVIPGDIGPVLEEMSLFKLSTIHDEKELNRVAEQELDNVDFDDGTVEPEPLKKKVTWSKESGQLDDEGLFYKDTGDSEGEESELEIASDDETLGLKADPEPPTKKMTKAQLKKQEKRHPLITDLEQGDTDQRKKRKAESWFQQDLFAGVLEDDADEDMELDIALAKQRKPSAELKPDSPKGKSKKKSLVVAPELLEAEDESEKKQEKVTNGKDSGIEASDSDTDSDSDTESDSEEITKLQPKESEVGKSDGFEVVSKAETRGLKKRDLGPDGLALGTMMIQSKKAKRDLIDDAWNRYMYNDENLPSWFMEDEEENNKRPPPVTKELIALYREELKEANVRTIKKVVEAKARKKRRATKKMDKAKKKIESISADMGMTDYDKAQQIRSLYKKAMVTKKKEVKYVVSKKHTASARAKRPSGVDGNYKVVDKRMKADRRGKKAADRRNKKMGKGKMRRR